MEINYTVELTLPAVTASLDVIGKDINVAVKKDEEGFPIFSAKHIKGILRKKVYQFKRILEEKKGKSEVEKIANDFVNKYFGKEGNYLINNEFNQIRFSNLTLKNLQEFKESDIQNRYGIKVNRKTKTTVPQSLFNYELLKKGIIFEGSLDVKDDICEKDLEFLLACLFHLDRIGGMNSRGIGKVKVQVQSKDIKDLKEIVKSLKNYKSNKSSLLNNIDLKESKLKKYTYTLELLEPVILKSRELGNYIESRDSIQGSTIRGALIEYFYKKYKKDEKENSKYNDELLNKFKDIEASDARNGEVKLVSKFETKYIVKAENEKIKQDRFLVPSDKYENIELVRISLSDLKEKRNEIGIKIEPRLKSVEIGMLFNLEYISNKEEKDKKKKNTELKGDLKLPENLFELEKEFNIYIGKLKSKGFGKVKIKIEEYKENNESSIEDRIKALNLKIEERDETEKEDIICFDLQSDIVLPFQDIYNAGEQFLILSSLENKNIRFNSRRSFINTGKLSGYNIINDIRKVDEIIFCKGSVFAYNVDNYKNILEELKKIEENGLGLRKNEGFGRVKICSIRPKEKEEILKKEKELDKNIIKKEFEEKHINNEKFKKAIEGISLSQISRFYSILESRNFFSKSKKVEEFVNTQLKKIENSNEKYSLSEAKLFFEYFKENFLTEEFSKENERNKIQFELIRACVRYYIGIERIEEKLKQGDEE
jgi:hypothetical protein